jgi:hypothetical protein
MRIFIASIGVRNFHFATAPWAVNLIHPLEDLGHEVVVSDIDWESAMPFVEDAAWIRNNRPRLSQALWDEVSKAQHTRPLDLFFSYLYSAHVEPGVVRQIRALGIPTVNFYCNAAHQFHLVSEIAPAFDFCWVPEKQALSAYKQAGANPLHVQMGANPKFYRPLPHIEHSIDVAFAGSLYADRAIVLSALIRQRAPLQIYTSAPLAQPGNDDGGIPAMQQRARRILNDLVHSGVMEAARRAVRGFATQRALRRLMPHIYPPAPNLVELFAKARIVLNLSHVYDGGRPGGALKAHVRLREFEAPLCRALYAPQYCDELSEYYDLAREVIGWRHPEECADKLRFYLSHPAEAEKIREAGYRRALAEHTAHRRFQQLFRMMGLQ